MFHWGCFGSSIFLRCRNLRCINLQVSLLETHLNKQRNCKLQFLFSFFIHIYHMLVLKIHFSKNILIHEATVAICVQKIIHVRDKVHQEGLLYPKIKPNRHIGYLTRSSGILYKPEGLYSVKTTASLYFIQLITRLFTTKHTN